MRWPVISSLNDALFAPPVFCAGAGGSADSTLDNNPDITSGALLGSDFNVLAICFP